MKGGGNRGIICRDYDRLLHGPSLHTTIYAQGDKGSHWRRIELDIS